jgi:prepilin-type N-terminal cleavage/methylation domain-containing protein
MRTPPADSCFQLLRAHIPLISAVFQRGTRLALYLAESREVYTMHALRRLKIRSGQAGFTLAEIMVACAIISVGLVAVSTGFGFGVDGVEAGRQQSTAVFLAEQRIEQAKELAARKPNLADLNTTNLPATEAYGSISGAPSTYRRDTTITLNPGGTTGARVDVIVSYKPVTGRGVLSTERSVSLSIFLANR